MKTPEMTPETNVHTLARYAADLSERIRDEDPEEMRAALIELCAEHPVKAAQLLMVFAAWVDPDEPVQRRVSRVEAISRPRLRRTA